MEQLPLFFLGCVIFFTVITGVVLYGMYTLREISERENQLNAGVEISGGIGSRVGYGNNVNSATGDTSKNT
jgi:hypothetical protein